MGLAILRGAARGALKEPAYLAVRVGGLAVGVATAGLALAFARWELGYDGDVADGERIYRVVTEADVELPAALGTQLDGSPHVRRWARLARGWLPLLSDGAERKRFSWVMSADAGFPELLDLTWLEGDRSTALEGVRGFAISDELRRFFFGNGQALGRQLLWDDARELVVTGVFVAPRHSHLRFDAVAAWLHEIPRPNRNELKRAATTYALVDDPAAVSVVEAQLQAFLEEHGRPRPRVQLQPLREIYLDPPRQGELGDHGDPWLVAAALTAAALVLVLAAINFVNITIAQLSTRTREIGVHRSLGGSRTSLLVRLSLEGLLASLAATLLGLGLVWLASRWGAGLVPIARSLPGLGLHGMYAHLLGVGVVAGLAASVHPAYVASRWNVAATLRGHARGPVRRQLSLRDGMLLLQLGLCVAALTGAIVVHGQARRLLTTDLGFDAGQILVTHYNYPQVSGNYARLKEALTQSPYVAGVLRVRDAPMQPLRGVTVTRRLALGSRPAHDVDAAVLRAEPGYLQLFGHQLTAGEGFGGQREQPQSIVLNERAAHALGVTPADLLGARVRLEDDEFTVTGVVADFHHEPVVHPIRPLAVVPVDYGSIAIRVAGSLTAERLAAVQAAWDSVLPGFPLHYEVLAAAAHGALAKERALAHLLWLCVAVTLAIGLVGVSAMASFAARRRAREIAVRRVLGASLGQTLRVLVLPYVRLAAVAAALVLPATAWLCLHWLSAYPERVAAGQVYAAGLAAALATLAGVVVSSASQALGLARQEVTRTLRTE